MNCIYVFLVVMQRAVSTLMNSKMLIFSFQFANLCLKGDEAPSVPRASVPALNHIKHGSVSQGPETMAFCSTSRHLTSYISLHLLRFCGLFTSLINRCTEHLGGTEESWSRELLKKQLSALKSQDCLYLSGLVPNNFKHTERINSNIELLVGLAVAQCIVNERTMRENRYNRLHFIKSRSREKPGMEKVLGIDTNCGSVIHKERDPIQNSGQPVWKCKCKCKCM